MKKATETKFNPDENALIRDLMTKLYDHAECAAFNKSSSRVVLGIGGFNKKFKKIEIIKNSDAVFAVEVVTGHFVTCSMTWKDSFKNLLRRMELELVHPEFQED
jgi:hypothetical protein